MLAVDTNVLVRMLVDDPDAQRQCEAARRAATEAGSVYVSQVVQVETVWVLERGYEVAKSALVDILERVVGNSAFTLQRPEVFRVALHAFRTGRADFADYIILAEAHAHGATLATFDRKLGKHPGAALLLT